MEKKASQRSDAEIVRQVIEGEVNAFEHLLRRYEKYVLNIARRHVPPADVEDTTQDVFIRAYRALPGFKEKGPFQQWLSRIAVRTCYDFWRRRYRLREVPMGDLSQRHQEWLEEVLSKQADNALSEEDVRKEATELLDWALNKLSAEERMVLELVYLEGRSGKEAADLLGWSIANVKVRSFRSRKKLEKLLRGVMREGRRAP
ncbi:MAG: sigma-70 family RNA polymerase sigma factor [Desulfobacterales bacterium]|nr:sigma-70 family RNA polymerase sigma factor [Desulfobacterales bacterium]